MMETVNRFARPERNFKAEKVPETKRSNRYS